MGFSFLSGSIETTNDLEASNGFIIPSQVEPALGLPDVDGSLLSSDTDGFRYWVPRNFITVNTAVFATNSEFSYLANNASYLQGSTWSYPAKIGDGTPNTAAFSQISVVGNVSLSNSGYVELNSVSHATSKAFTSNTITQKVVAEFPADVYRGGKIVIQVYKPLDNITTISEFLIVHDNSDVYSTEYGIITTGYNAPLVSFETNIVSNMVRFLATPITSDDLNFKISETLFLV